MIHFCVGPFNTCQDKEGKPMAVIIGVAIDLQSQHIFPASFPWNDFQDFSLQLKDRVFRFTSINHCVGI